MEDFFTLERILLHWNNVSEWIRANVLVVDNAVQAAVNVLTFGIAELITRRLAPLLSRFETHASFGRAAHVAAPLVRPMILLALQGLSIAGAARFGQPYGLMSTAATLLGAWIAIRLASQIAKNRVWSRLIAWTAWSIAALSILELLDPTIAILDSVAIQFGQLRISIYTVAKSTVALAVLLSVALHLTGLIESRIRTSRALSPTVQVLFAKSLKMVLVGLAVLVAIRSVGIDLTALAVLGGAIGLGVGFGLQKIVSNLISGVILLIDKSIKPGDVIAVSGTYGWVTALGGRYVSVVTRDGVEHLIPNDTLISERVENWTHTHSQTRIRVDVGVHYDSDLIQVIAICEEAAKETERVLKDPEPKCLFIDFGDSAVKLQIRFWIADSQNGVQNVKRAVLLRVWQKFKDQSIEVPYPQRVVHVRTGGEALAPAPAPAERNAA
jgi:small-conductance mechanosensitive channel